MREREGKRDKREGQGGREGRLNESEKRQISGFKACFKNCV